VCGGVSATGDRAPFPDGLRGRLRGARELANKMRGHYSVATHLQKEVGILRDRDRVRVEELDFLE